MTTKTATVSPELYEFFQVERRNEEIMRREAVDDGYDEDAEDYVPPSTLGSAHDSLCQAPDDIIQDWMWSHLVEHPESYSTTPALIEFGRLLERLGPDFLLEDITCEGD